MIKDATEEDIPVIQDIAHNTWWKSYSTILSPAQISYMLEEMYSESTLRRLIRERSQSFIFIEEAGVKAGFAAYGILPEPSTAKLHKLYVLPEYHGKGLGRRLLDEVKKRMKETGVKYLVLNVNRFNPARHFYEREGFSIFQEVDIPIGPYQMNDYVMRLVL